MPFLKKQTKPSIAFSTDLTSAIKEKNLDSVYFLLRRGVDINGRNSDGTTALHWAAADGSVDLVMTLLDEGANVSVHDFLHRTPMDFAKDKGHEGVIQIMSLYSRTELNETPLMRAINLNYEAQIPQLLKKTKNLNDKNKEGNTALMLAAKKGRLPLVLALLSNGAEVSIQNQEGYSASQLAMQNGFLYLAQLLIHYQAVHVGKQGGEMPFLRAVAWGYEEIIPLLLLKIGNKEARTQEGNTALLLAAQYGRESVVSLLLKHTVNIHTRNKKGDTALSLAVKNGYYNVAHMLIEEGADLNSENEEGDTPLMLAAKGGYIDLASLLLTKGADLPKNGFSRFGYRQDITRLITRYQDVGVHLQEGSTPLLRAVERGYLDLSMLWMEKGAELEARNPRNETALMIATRRRDCALMKALIDNGASLNEVDSDNMTALTRARQMWLRKKPIGLLIKSGASIIPRSEESEDLKPYMVPLLESCLNQGDLVGAQNVVKTCLETYADPHLSEKMHAVLKQYFLEIPKLNFLQKWFVKLMDFLYPKQAALRVAAKIGDRQSENGRAAYEFLVSRLVLHSVVHHRKMTIEQIVERSESKGRDKLRYKLYLEYGFAPPERTLSGNSPESKKLEPPLIPTLTPAFAPVGASPKVTMRV